MRIKDMVVWGLAVAIGLLALCLPWQGLGAVQAEPLLPPRPTPPPVQPGSPPVPGSSEGPRSGPFIILVVDWANPAGDLASRWQQLWTVVEWVDAQGQWHLVEGWQGNLDEPYRKIWGVSEKDLGKGPFHWVVLDRQGGEVVGVSAPFYLPRAPNDSTIVHLRLVDKPIVPSGADGESEP
jgi:hypothetical protein